MCQYNPEKVSISCLLTKIEDWIMFGLQKDTLLIFIKFILGVVGFVHDVKESLQNKYQPMSITEFTHFLKNT